MCCENDLSFPGEILAFSVDFCLDPGHGSTMRSYMITAGNVNYVSHIYVYMHLLNSTSLADNLCRLMRIFPVISVQFNDVASCCMLCMIQG